MSLERTLDDATLISLIKEGNHLAFQEVYQRYWDRLFGYAYNLLQNRDASEEVIQEIYCWLWEKRDTIQITTSLSGYLHSMVKHEVLKQIRSEKFRARYAQHHQEFLQHRADNSNIEYQNFTDLERAIEAGLNELPERERTVFRLSRQKHLKLDEVAERMQLSKGTVENYLVKALRKLRERLKGDN